MRSSCNLAVITAAGRPELPASMREGGVAGRPPRAARIAALRQALARLETVAAAGSRGGACQPLEPALGPALAPSLGPPLGLPLGLPQVHRHLPDAGLACGVVNEVAADAYGSRPAALGFVLALAALALHARPAPGFGPAVLVTTRRALGELGAPYGHGLAQLGLDVGRLLLVETKTDKDALWALEEILRSQARPALVAGALGGGLDLTLSRRLNLAAAPQRTPLVLLRPPQADGASAAAARWRIGAAPAARDRFGTFAHPRWRVALERVRNGRPGEWLIEWDHVAHRFRVAEGVADRAPAAVAGLRRAG